MLNELGFVMMYIHSPLATPSPRQHFALPMVCYSSAASQQTASHFPVLFIHFSGKKEGKKQA